MKITDICTGCTCCKNICPTECIEMQPNESLALIPKIDESKCIKCKLCQKACPMNNESNFQKPLKCYAAWANDDNQRATSTSGGIAASLLEYYIENNQIVYGVAFDNEMSVNYKRVNEKQDLKKLKGSKYVYGNPKEIFKNVQADLNNKLEVLFIGIPCQIDGLKHFLRKDYNNLITVDLVCHGVPPFAYLEQYVKKICRKNHEINNIQFRDKEVYDLYLKRDEKIIKKKKYLNDLYQFAFCNAVILRDNCYSCKYAQQKRITDITIGDFWGLGNKKEFQFSKEKVSLILVNTGKGQELINKNQDKIFIVERDIEEAIAGNGQLQEPSKRTKYSENFKKLIKEHDFYTAIKKTGIKKEMFKNKIPNFIRASIIKFKNKFINK